jgi:hypothetical protein
MTTILVIVVVVILLGGGYWGHAQWGNQGLGGVLGLVLIIVLILWLTGNLGSLR